MRCNMTNQDKMGLQYRFSGYQYQTLILDETGPGYIVIQTPHPYYINQPAYWAEPYYYLHPGTINRQPNIVNTGSIQRTNQNLTPMVSLKNN